MTISRGNGETEHEGKLRAALLHGFAGSLDGNTGVLHIEDRLDKQPVDATFDERVNLFAVCGLESGSLSKTVSRRRGYA